MWLNKSTKTIETAYPTNKKKSRRRIVLVLSLVLILGAFYYSYTSGILDRVGLFKNIVAIDTENLAVDDLKNIKLSFVKEGDTTNIDITSNEKIILTDWYGKYHLSCCVYNQCFRIGFNDFKFDGYKKVTARISFKRVQNQILVDLILKTKWEEVKGKEHLVL